MSFKKIMAVLVVASLVLTATVAQAGVVAIQNGSFETGDFSGWDAIGTIDEVGVFISGGSWPSAHDGDYVGYVGPSDGRIYQKLTTDGSAEYQFASVGDTLTVNFYLVKHSTAGTPDFHVNLWANNAPEPWESGGYIDDSDDFTVAAEVWTLNTFTYTAEADDIGDTLWLQFDSSSSSYPVLIDAVSASYTPIPEPSTLVLLVAGLAGLLCYAWRKRK